MTDLVNPSRRTLVRGAAWSAPVIAVASAAPAFAASPCDPQTYRLDWGTSPYTPPVSLNASPNVGTATVTGSAGGSAISVSFRSDLTGAGVSRFDGNLTVLPTTNIGGLGAGERGLAVRTSGTSLTSLTRQTLTVTFGRAITNLSFTVVDIDRDANFWDRVAFSPVPTSYSRASTVVGVGNTAAESGPNDGPFRYTGGTTGVGDTSSAGNAGVTFAGGAGFTSFQLIYWNAGAPGPQGILLSDLTFTAPGC